MPIDPSDYKEPSCPLSGGEDFYYPDRAGSKPQENIPIQNIIAKLDESLNREDYDEADRMLRYWLEDARAMGDRHGELSILNEFLGLSRKRNDREQGLSAVKESLALIRELGIEDQVNAATIRLNAATTLKCFGKPEEALPVYEEVLSLYNKKLPEDDALFAGLLNNMALTLTDLNRFDEALDYFRKAAGIMKKKPDGSPDAAISYCNMAELYEKKYSGDSFAELRENLIREVCDKAWDLLNDPSVSHNGYYAFVCRKCAPGFGYYGFFTRRKELDRRADEIYGKNREKQ